MTDLASIKPLDYLKEEWQLRTWWGKLTVPFEAVCLWSIQKIMSIHVVLPKVYKDGENDE